MTATSFYFEDAHINESFYRYVSVTWIVEVQASANAILWLEASKQSNSSNSIADDFDHVFFYNFKVGKISCFNLEGKRNLCFIEYTN
jgi:hypothetical protein